MSKCDLQSEKAYPEKIGDAQLYQARRQPTGRAWKSEEEK